MPSSDSASVFGVLPGLVWQNVIHKSDSLREILRLCRLNSAFQRLVESEAKRRFAGDLSLRLFSFPNKELEQLCPNQRRKGALAALNASLLHLVEVPEALKTVLRLASPRSLRLASLHPPQHLASLALHSEEAAFLRRLRDGVRDAVASAPKAHLARLGSVSLEGLFGDQSLAEKLSRASAASLRRLTFHFQFCHHGSLLLTFAKALKKTPNLTSLRILDDGVHDFEMSGEHSLQPMLRALPAGLEELELGGSLASAIVSFPDLEAMGHVDGLRRLALPRCYLLGPILQEYAQSDKDFLLRVRELEGPLCSTFLSGETSLGLGRLLPELARLRNTNGCEGPAEVGLVAAALLEEHHSGEERALRLDWPLVGEDVQASDLLTLLPDLYQGDFGGKAMEASSGDAEEAGLAGAFECALAVHSGRFRLTICANENNTELAF